MNERSHDSFEERTKALFHDSVDGLDYALRSRLTQARNAALEAAARAAAVVCPPRSVVAAAGVTAAAVLGAFLWLGSPLGQHTVTLADGQSNFEDLEIVASSEEGSADAMDMLQDDLEFYDWAEKAANSEPAA